MAKSKQPIHTCGAWLLHKGRRCVVTAEWDTGKVEINYQNGDTGLLTLHQQREAKFLGFGGAPSGKPHEIVTPEKQGTATHVITIVEAVQL